MNYIRVNEDNTVLVGGQVATKKILEDGWVKYEGDIPKLTNDFQHLEMVDGVLTVIEDTQAKKEAERKEAKKVRDEALQNLTYALPDGSVYQVRPQDVPNFQLAIQRNQDVKWILADNNVRLTTIDELKEILDYGIQEGTKIWDEYTQKLEEINNQVK